MKFIIIVGYRQPQYKREIMLFKNIALVLKFGFSKKKKVDIEEFV
jgi:hypothetical protein